MGSTRAREDVGGRILVVEDERVVARDLTRTLGDLGYDVVGTATTADEAVQRARELAPDLVLMDVRLGGASDGIDAAAAIRREREVAIIYLTAHSDDDTLVRARATEPLGYLVKPFRAPELRCAIEIALHKQQITARLQARDAWLRATLRSTGGDDVAIAPNPVAHALTGWASGEAAGTPRERNDLLEAQVAGRVAQLEEAIRELEAFNVSVAHDLRAPLRGIAGLSQVLLEEHSANLGAEGFNYLTRIRRASQQMSQLIEDLLRLSEVSRCAIAKQPVDLGPIARAVFDELAAREPRRRVELVIAGELAVVGDARLLHIAMINLLDNAWKFTALVPAARIEIGEHAAGGERAIAVRDNGAGFDMRDAGRLFVAFERLHSADQFPGTGIGLAIVHRIVERHGGRIWAESEPGRGATFFLAL